MNSLAVALVLTAVNNLSPGIDSAVSKVKEFEKAVEFAKGMAEAKAFDYAVGFAADFEDVMKKVELANYDALVPMNIQKKQLEELSKLSMNLGRDTVFSNIEAAKSELTLIKNGMDYIDVLEGGAQAAVYLAQTAEESTTVTADAVSQITNMFQLSGSQLMQTADDINRAANASSAGVTDIMNDLQQTGQSAYNLGLNVKDTTLLLGTLHNMGLGDSSGTFLNDLLLRLDAVSPEAQKALYNLGLLKGAKVTTTSSGKTKIVGGESSLFDEKGQIKSAQDLVNSLRQTLYNNQIDPKMLFDKSGNMISNDELDTIFGAKKANQVIKDMKEAFGVQGMRAAIALTVSGKGSYEEMVQKAQRMKDIQSQVIEMQGTLAGMFEAAHGSWETLMTAGSTPLGQELKKTLGTITEVINKTLEWVQTNPKVATAILKVVGVLAMVNLGMGALKIMFGNVAGLFASGGGVFLKSFRYFKGFGETFNLLTKVMGQGKITSFFKAFTFGTKLDFIPRMFGTIGKGALGLVGTVSKVGGAFLKTGAQALVAGAKMALAWLIGLGPVGWIILGISALVIAAIAAWKTNFLGFRDKVLEVWEKIKGVFEKVKEFFGFKNDSITQEAVDKASSVDYNLSRSKTPTIRTSNNRSIVDNRQYIYNVKSTDPRLAAKEISRDNKNDKYLKSRDPKLQFEY